jgi:hypothetical protein
MALRAILTVQSMGLDRQALRTWPPGEMMVPQHTDILRELYHMPFLLAVASH